MNKRKCFTRSVSLIIFLSLLFTSCGLGESSPVVTPPLNTWTPAPTHTAIVNLTATAAAQQYKIDLEAFKILDAFILPDPDTFPNTQIEEAYKAGKFSEAHQKLSDFFRLWIKAGIFWQEPISEIVKNPKYLASVHVHVIPGVLGSQEYLGILVLSFDQSQFPDYYSQPIDTTSFKYVETIPYYFPGQVLEQKYWPMINERLTLGSDGLWPVHLDEDGNIAEIFGQEGKWAPVPKTLHAGSVSRIVPLRTIGIGRPYEMFYYPDTNLIGVFSIENACFFSPETLLPDYCYSFKHLAHYHSLDTTGKILAKFLVDEQTVLVLNALDGTELARVPVTGEIKEGTWSIQISPDSKYVLLRHNPSHYNDLRQWSGFLNTRGIVLSVEEQRQLGVVEDFHQASFTPTQNLIAIAPGDKNEIQVRNLIDLRLVTTIPIDEPADSVLYSPDGQFLVSMIKETQARAVEIFQTTDYQRVWSTYSKDRIMNAAFSPDGEFFSYSTLPNWIRLVRTGDWSDDRLVSTRFKYFANRTVFSPDNSQFLNFFDSAQISDMGEAYGDNLVAWMDVNSGQIIRKLNAYQTVFSSDSKQLFVIHNSGDIERWEAGQDTPTLKRSLSVGTRFAFSLDGKQISTSKFGMINIWDVSSGELLNTFGQEDPGWESEVIYLSGERLAVGTSTGDILIWDTHNGTLSETIDLDTSGLSNLAASPDGRLLAFTSGVKEEFYLWDVEGRKTIDLAIPTNWVGKIDGVNDLAFSPDGKLLWLTLGFDGGRGSGSRAWQVADCLSTSGVGSCGQTQGDIYPRMYRLTFTPDNQLGVTVSVRNYFRCLFTLNLTNGATTQVTAGPKDEMIGYTFSPDGGSLVVDTVMFRDSSELRFWLSYELQLLKAFPISSHGYGQSPLFSADNLSLGVIIGDGSGVQIFGIR